MEQKLVNTDEDAFFQTNRVRPSYSFRSGDAIRVTRGALAGATGVLQGIGADQRCIITMDGLKNGVNIILPSASMELADPLFY